MGKINSQTTTNLSFSGTQTGNFEAIIDDVAYTLNIMTYNVQRKKYRPHAEVIKSSGADVVSIQEVGGQRKFNILKNETGFKGKMCVTLNVVDVYKYGIVLLWNETKLGKPIAVTNHKIETPKDKTDSKRAYIIAEFNDFCVIATHLSTNADENKKMVEAILKEDVIKNYRKPVYIAGDLNPRPKAGDSPRPDGYETKKALVDAGFEMLSNTDKNDPEYYNKHATRPNGSQPDLILGYNQHPNREIIWRGVPDGADRTFTISDHLPYVVKVKYK